MEVTDNLDKSSLNAEVRLKSNGRGLGRAREEGTEDSMRALTACQDALPWETLLKRILYLPELSEQRIEWPLL